RAILGLLWLARAEVDFAEIEQSRVVLRVDGNGAPQILKSAVPVAKAHAALRTLVERGSKSRIDLQGASIRDLCFRIFAVLEVGIALIDEFLLANVGVAKTARKQKRKGQETTAGDCELGPMAHEGDPCWAGNFHEEYRLAYTRATGCNLLSLGW